MTNNREVPRTRKWRGGKDCGELAQTKRRLRNKSVLIWFNQVISIKTDWCAHMRAASRGCKSVGRALRGCRNPPREYSRKAATSRVSKSPRRRCVFSQEKLLACDSSTTFSCLFLPRLGAFYGHRLMRPHARVRWGHVRLRVPAAGRCFGFCTGGQQRSDGWLHSFPLSNVRHAVDRLDSIWALVYKKKKTKKKTHLFP